MKPWPQNAKNKSLISPIYGHSDIIIVELKQVQKQLELWNADVHESIQNKLSDRKLRQQ